MIPFNLADNLNQTWIIDLDGTIFEHNGFLAGNDKLLPGVKELWKQFKNDDVIVICTARSEEYKDITLKSLNENNLRYNHIIFEVTTGERIIINDTKPKGLQTALSWPVERNKGFISK